MTKLKLPLTAQLEITDACNFRCKHCYILDSERKPKSGLEPKEQTVMNIAHKFVENDIFNVILTGGEPMMRPNLLIKLVEYLSSNNINVMVNSNITLLTEEILECFMKNKIRNVLVSCPSYKEDDSLVSLKII